MNKFIKDSIESSDITELLKRVEGWFESEQAATSWYNTEYLSAFGGLTPRQVVERYRDKGISELNKWITERELGGFQ